MTDSRVVRRCTFIPTSRAKDDPNIARHTVENECVIFDARLLDEKNVFANPIVTVINNGEDHVDGNAVKTNCLVSKVHCIMLSFDTVALCQSSIDTDTTSCSLIS